MELAAGTRVGGYVVEAVRARLPHVVVHRARHVVTDRPVALQVLRPIADAPSLRAIHRDLAALNRLRHANIAEILEHGDLDDGRPYLVAEWVAGRSLQTLLDEHGPLSLADTLPIAEEIGAALIAAHTLGVVHGELLARNVGLVKRGEHQTIKLVNFGMARLSGTRLAPEQSRSATPPSATSLDRRVDVFALGALLYQMVTGVRPSAEPAPPSVSADAPHAFDQLVLRCLRADPSLRWDGVEPLLAALRAAVSGSELVAELTVTAFLAPDIELVETAALEDAERALVLAQRWLEAQKVALVLGGAGAVLATARIPRAIDPQRAARAGWVKLAKAVQALVDARRRKHPSVRTRVTIRFEG